MAVVSVVVVALEPGIVRALDMVGAGLFAYCIFLVAASLLLFSCLAFQSDQDLMHVEGNVFFFFSSSFFGNRIYMTGQR